LLGRFADQTAWFAKPQSASSARTSTSKQNDSATGNARINEFFIGNLLLVICAPMIRDSSG
jgi:hypothetical protein